MIDHVQFGLDGFMEFCEINSWDMLENVHMSGRDSMGFMQMVLLNRKINCLLHRNVENELMLGKVLEILGSA